MGNLFWRALTDTWRSFGFTLATGIRSVVVPAAFVLLLVMVRGLEHAMSQSADFALYAAAFAGAAIIPILVWNLWLAPYRLMRERLDKAIADGKLPSAHPPTQLTPAVIAQLDKTPVYKLGDAACLWVGLEPHNPIKDPRALARFHQLSGAARAGHLPGPDGLTAVAYALNARAWWPTHDHPVSAVALRRYAEHLGDVPAFLASVEVPESDAATASDEGA